MLEINNFKEEHSSTHNGNMLPGQNSYISEFLLNIGHMTTFTSADGHDMYTFVRKIIMANKLSISKNTSKLYLPQ
jgi:hypothetical protein